MQTARNIEGNERMETQNNEVLDNVVTINRMKQFRQEIGLIADRSVRSRIISDESYRNYRQVVTGQEEHELSVEMLKGMRDFAKKHEDKAGEIAVHIQRAKQEKVASDNDEKFLMSALILENEFTFAQNAAQIENVVAKKIENMKKDRKEYDDIANHKLVKNVGFIKTGENEKLEVPDEKKFLEMKVPERREFLKKAKEALPKAEEYAEKIGEAISFENVKEYKGLLDKAMKDKIIGVKTQQKFMDGFKKIDGKEQEYWIKEFPKEMERYEKMWGEVRSTLQGDALSKIEGMIDEKGYSEIFTAFGSTCEKEKTRLDESYKNELGKFKEKGYVGEHSVNEYNAWMGKQELKDKYDALEKMHDGPGGQMARYKKLNEDIENNLPGKAQKYLEGKRDEWGYTEMNSQYQRFIQGEKVPSESSVSRSTSDPLSIINSGATRAAIVETNLSLKKRGKEKQGTFLRRVKRMFINENKDSFDASGFQSRLKQNKEDIKERGDVQRKPEESKGADVLDFQSKLKASRRNNEEVDRTKVDEEMHELEQTGKAKAVDDHGFKQVETKADKGHTERKTQVEINRDQAMDRFFTEDHRHQYRSKIEGGQDDLSLAVHTEDGRTVELNLTEIRAMGKYMEEDMQKVDEGESLDKAT